LAWPYASAGEGTVVGSTGLLRGTPNTALLDVCTTLPTPARRQCCSSSAVPSTLTVRSSSSSFANGTWATLL
jgi:hypothetical protein